MSEIDILADVSREGSDPFAAFERDTQTESLPETKPEENKEVAQEEVEDVPFHKHPRWVERERELEELRERDAEREQRLQEFEAKLNEIPDNESDSSIPDWFTELYGDNQVAWQKYSQHEEERTAEIEARILARQTEEQTRAVQESERWNKWVDDELGKLESDGLQFDKNKLIKVMLEYRPTDENNNFDFHAGHKIYEALEGKQDTSKSDARKQLADTTTATSTKGDPAPKNYMTTAELRNRSMSSL